MFKMAGKMLIRCMSVFLLCFLISITGKAAGIETVLQGKQTESAGGALENFADYDIPIGMIQKESEPASQSQTEGNLQNGGDQERIDKTVIVGARTLDRSRMEWLSVCFGISALVLVVGIRRGSRKKISG